MFGEMLEKGQQTTVKTVKSVVSSTASSVAGQLGIKPEASPDNSGNAKTQTSVQAKPQAEGSTSKAASTPETMDLVREFYAPSDDAQKVNPADKQKDDLVAQQKLVKLRQELHQSTYYEPLIAYETKKPQQEEGVAEKVEREKKEEQQKKMVLEEKKAKEKQDIATSRAQRAVEANRGVAG